MVARDHGGLVGLIDNKLQATPLTEVVHRAKRLDTSLLDLERTLAR